MAHGPVVNILDLYLSPDSFLHAVQSLEGKLRSDGVVLVRMMPSAARIIQRAYAAAKTGFGNSFGPVSMQTLADSGYSVLSEQRKELFDARENAALMPHPTGPLVDKVGVRPTLLFLRPPRIDGALRRSL